MSCTYLPHLHPLQFAALGRDLERWPPYISNLAFELWELKPPSYTPQNNMAPRNRSSSSSSYTANGSAASDTPGPFVVRVLYNKQPLPLPGAPAGGEVCCYIAFPIVQSLLFLH